MDTFRDVPEFFEVDIGESLVARTEILATFRELGPPDLCHTVKSQGKSPKDEQLGTYHYVSGVDASSSASLAAYLNSLTYAVEDNAAWFSKSTAFKVRNGCYCCFNAFSRVDIRVDVKIPGGVSAYVVDLRGERHEATPEMWQETYLSAILRAILYSDDPNYRLMGYRKLDPITTHEAEIRFLQTAEALFVKGWQLGSAPEVQVASIASNHLTAGILKYFGDSFRYSQSVNLFEKLYVKYPEVASLLAQSYIGMNEEIKAVEIMASAFRQHPMTYTLLHVQCDFLRSKGKLEWALQLARQAVSCSPSEFLTWAKLTEVYIDLGQYESALLTLNSCPMFTYADRDLHRMPTPQRTHLPVKQFIVDSQLLGEDREDDIEVDPALRRLPAPNLRGTFAKAYSLLTRLVSQIGWDELLSTRSTVFVMEEEYRMQKAQVEINTVLQATATKQTNGTTTESEANADDNASTRGVISPSHTPMGSEVETNASTLNIPTIRISNYGDGEEKEDKETRAENVRDTDSVTLKEETVSVDKPVLAAVSDNGDHQHTEEDGLGSSEPFSFHNKRLCERWLDNLFMVLYEDLRVWTIFRAEVAHFKTQHVAYRKSSSEWEILGDLGVRLHHKEESKEAYQRALDAKFSYRAWSKLLEMYSEEGDLLRALQAAIRMTAHNHRYYVEMSYPSPVANHFYKLGQMYGHGKISYTLMSMGLPEPILKIMEGYLRYGRNFKVEGYDF